MKKMLGIVITIVMIATFTVPVFAEVIPDAETPEFSEAERPEPELLPQEILDAFEGGMSIDEFLINNTGPIPNALLEYADLTVTVVVQLDKPSLIEYINAEGLGRSDRTDDQTAYVAELESDQAAVLSEITAGRADDVQQIGESFTMTLNGFMLNVPASMVNEIRSISGVKAVTKAPEYNINLEYSIPLINADMAWEYSEFMGEGVTIAVIDTGIDYTHSAFGGSGDAADYAGNDPSVIEPGTFPTAKVIGGYDFAGTAYTPGAVPVPDDDPLDERGHGTHVASIAAGGTVDHPLGVAPGASLYALKIFGEDGGTNLTLHAIEWAMDPNGLGHLGEPVDVINMSLGADWGPADESDPEFQAVENATSIGVVVVASAGNAGDSSYIVGAPSTADSAISVAASSTGYEYYSLITFGVDSFVTYTPSENLIAEDITAEIVDVSVAIDPTGLLCTVPEGQEGALEGMIALISRGSCSFEDKINNAETLGAVAAVVYNNTTGVISMATGESTLPACSITQADGAILQGVAPTEVTIDSEYNMTAFVSNDPPNTIGSFSSRGPRGFDSALKPEITAPGVSIYAAAMGTGHDGTAMSGTSMAAPHVAGVAALLVQAHPDWEPVHIKAAMMNTADDLTGDARFVVPLQGAGLVDAYEAISTQIVAYADPGLVSLSWGVIEINEDYSDTKQITIRNDSGASILFDVSTIFTSYYSDGATLTPSVNSVTVPPYSATSIEVTLDLDGSLVLQGFGYLEEYYGFVSLHNDDGEIRLPFYFVPQPYAEITEIEAYTEFEVNTDMGLFALESSGGTGSSLWAYPVGLVSDDDPEVLDSGDLRYVGMDYGWEETDYGFGHIFTPAFAMWDGIHTNQPYFTEVDLYIYTEYGSVTDFNFNYGWLSGADDDNDWVVLQTDPDYPGSIFLASPYSIYADYNSGFQEWWLPAGYQYVADEFVYEVVSFDYYGNYDYAGAASFDITRPPMSFGYTTQEPENSSFIAGVWVDDFESYIGHDIKGMMLVDYFGKAGVGQAYFWELSPYENTFIPSMFLQ